MECFAPHNNNDDDDDDVLKYLNFSDAEFEEPLALPAPPQEAVSSSSPPVVTDEFDMSVLDNLDTDLLWDTIEAAPPLTIEGPPLVNNDGDVCPAAAPVLGDVDEPMAASSPMWVSARHLDCSCCHVLRVVVHSDGIRRVKLALHGGVGVFYHAILDIYYDVNGMLMPAVEQSYIDLNGRSLEWVKQFIVNYGFTRFRESYAIMQDSLSTFYDALCVSMRYEENPSNVSQPPAMPEPGLCQSRPAEMDSSNLTEKTKLRIATQRERTRGLRLKDLASYVHLPIQEAAKELQICPTALKKVCRKHGIRRWPYRKIRSMDREISALQRELRSASSEEALRTQAKIDKLKAERARVCAVPPP
ncbi:hypothetical protein Cni_G20353 [Canna indica]|uniref:RWP-RK domain-containing protein n=1 Tax=Canna indica TaxID=4628 RepID=A0AAQ3KN17_9LILI|nr:hypothetical protein Cni_G20353 [Canna indica]